MHLVKLFLFLLGRVSKSEARTNFLSRKHPVSWPEIQFFGWPSTGLTRFCTEKPVLPKG